MSKNLEDQLLNLATIAKEAGLQNFIIAVEYDNPATKDVSEIGIIVNGAQASVQRLVLHQVDQLTIPLLNDELKNKMN